MSWYTCRNIHNFKNQVKIVCKHARTNCSGWNSEMVHKSIFGTYSETGLEIFIYFKHCSLIFDIKKQFILFMLVIRCIADFIVFFISAILLSLAVNDAFCVFTLSFNSLFSFSSSSIFFSSSFCCTALMAAVAASLDYTTKQSLHQLIRIHLTTPIK